MGCGLCRISAENLVMLGAKTREDIGIGEEDVKNIADGATGGIMA